MLAIFATLFGITISLGLGASQIASGLNYLFEITASDQLKLALILMVSAIAIVSENHHWANSMPPLMIRTNQALTPNEISTAARLT